MSELSEYQQLLRDAYRGEVLGAAFFAALAARRSYSTTTGTTDATAEAVADLIPDVTGSESSTESTTAPSPFDDYLCGDTEGGTISTGRAERFKATAYVMGRQLRSDGVRISVFRQVRQGNNWVDAIVQVILPSAVLNMLASPIIARLMLALHRRVEPVSGAW